MITFLFLALTNSLFIGMGDSRPVIPREETISAAPVQGPIVEALFEPTRFKLEPIEEDDARGDGHLPRCWIFGSISSIMLLYHGLRP